MQTSNNNYPDLVSPPDGFEQQEPEAAAVQDTHLRGVCFVLAVLLSFGMLGIWIMQNSVNAYFQQTYHRESPLMQLGDYSLWAKGGSIGDAMRRYVAAVKDGSFPDRVAHAYSAD